MRNGELEKETLVDLFQEIIQNHNGDWLCALDILEICKSDSLFDEIKNYLIELSEKSDYKVLILDGIKLLK